MQSRMILKGKQTMKTTLQTIVDKVDSLSLRFSKEIRDCTTSQELVEIIDRNRNMIMSCATHEFMDSNEQMAAAWLDVFKEPFLPCETEPSGLAIDLWNLAWDQSKESGFLNGADSGALAGVYEAWAGAQEFEEATPELAESQVHFLNLWVRAERKDNARAMAGVKA